MYFNPKVVFLTIISLFVINTNVNAQNLNFTDLQFIFNSNLSDSETLLMKKGFRFGKLEEEIIGYRSFIWVGKKNGVKIQNQVNITYEIKSNKIKILTYITSNESNIIFIKNELKTNSYKYKETNIILTDKIQHVYSKGGLCVNVLTGKDEGNQKSIYQVSLNKCDSIFN
jgi:hypothetical protein